MFSEFCLSMSTLIFKQCIGALAVEVVSFKRSHVLSLHKSMLLFTSLFENVQFPSSTFLYSNLKGNYSLAQFQEPPCIQKSFK